MVRILRQLPWQCITSVLSWFLEVLQRHPPPQTPDVTVLVLIGAWWVCMTARRLFVNIWSAFWAASPDDRAGGRPPVVAMVITLIRILMNRSEDRRATPGHLSPQQWCKNAEKYETNSTFREPSEKRSIMQHRHWPAEIDRELFAVLP